MTTAEPRRTYEPPHRQPWNDPIRWVSKAIDQHTALHLQTGNSWHAEQAQVLSEYLHGLKRWLTTRP